MLINKRMQSRSSVQCLVQRRGQGRLRIVGQAGIPSSMERVGEDAEKARCRRAHEIPDSAALEGVNLASAPVYQRKDPHIEVAAYAWYIRNLVHNSDEAKLLYINELLQHGDNMGSSPLNVRTLERRRAGLRLGHLALPHQQFRVPVHTWVDAQANSASDHLGHFALVLGLQPSDASLLDAAVGGNEFGNN